jgi:hypothetical protein
VATIAPITRQPPHQLDAVNEFNKWLKEVAPNWGANCHIVDINAVLSNSDGTPNEKLLADGCHPNQAGYDLLGEAWGNAVEDLVSKGTLKKDTPATLEASLFALPAGKQSPIPGVGSISPSTSAAAAGSTLTISGNVTAGNCRMTAPVLTIQLTGDKKPSVAAEPTQTLGNIAPHATVPFKIEIKVPGNCDAGGYCIGAAAKSPEGTAAITYGPKVNVTK